MGQGRRAVALTPLETRRDVIVGMAQRADELGYEAFILPEGWGFDSTLVLTEIACRTSRIKVVSGILSMWGRTPGTIAMSAATLDQISGGRYVLGLGASTAALTEGFHDVPFERPAAKLRDTVAKVRALLEGERAHLERCDGAKPLRLGLPAAPGVPIWVAALGRKGRTTAAELADGWFPAYAGLDWLAGARAELEQVREAAGLRGGPLTLVSGPSSTVVGDVASGAANLAFYLTAMGDVYADFVVDQGYADEVAAVRAANPSPRPGQGVVPAEARVLVDQLVVAGDPAEVREGLARWDEVTDITTVGVPPGAPTGDIETLLTTCAP